MYKTASLAVLTALTLSACGGMSTAMSRAYIEPTEGKTAKVRVVTNGVLTFIPDRNCLDWNAPDIGIAASAENYLGKSPTHNGQKIGVSGEASKLTGFVSAEVLVKADQPLTLSFRSRSSDGHMNYWCEPIHIAFIPVAREEYEIFGGMDEYCRLYTKSLTRPGQYPVQKRVEQCK